MKVADLPINDARLLVVTLLKWASSVPASATTPTPALGDGEVESIRQACKLADAGTGDDKYQALTRLWDYLFPAEEYPGQRLNQRGAQALLQLAGKSAAAVCDRLLVLAPPRKSEVKYPFAISKAVLSKAPATRQQENASVIDDSWRMLAKLGREQAHDRPNVW